MFRELLRRFPQHRHAERAAWKVGWRAYRNGNFAEAADIFERAAAAFPRADNRPAWLYWSGAPRDQMDDASSANARYRLVVADYQNSYYGRLAADAAGGAPRAAGARRGQPLRPSAAAGRGADRRASFAR